MRTESFHAQCDWYSLTLWAIATEALKPGETMVNCLYGTLKILMAMVADMWIEI